MQNMVDLILNGATDYSPAVVVSLIVFVLTLECIGSIAHSILSVGRRR